MKIQYIAVIFLLVIVPIVLVMTVYTQLQVDNLGIQTQYDTKLYGATHDGMKAFQLNTVNNKFSQVSDSLKRDVEASINTFITSLSNNLGLGGYTSKDISPYIPAVLFTLYDGYYIYAPTYAEQLQEVERQGIDIDGNPITVVREESFPEKRYVKENILKPYIYYTVRYNKNQNNDFIVNYTLDNYMTLYGTVKGNYVTKSGFLIVPNDVTTFKIDNEKLQVILQRKVLKRVPTDGNLDNASADEIAYLFDRIKWNELSEATKAKLITEIGEDLVERLMTGETIVGVSDEKLLQELLDKTISETFEKPEDFIRTNDGKIIDEVIDAFEISYKGVAITDSSAKQYYAKALRFSKWVNDNVGDTKVSDARAIDGTEYIEYKNNSALLFNTQNGNNDPENLDSDFAQHRMNVIRLSIQTNLNVAIAQYNRNFFEEKTYNLKMPVIKETEWEQITNNVCMVSFLQGLQIGNKIYNHYSLVASTKNKEMIQPENIYYFKRDATGIVYYHRIGCPKLEDGNIIGYQNINYDIFKTKKEDQTLKYTFGDGIETIRKEGKITELSACYDCIINPNFTPITTLNTNRLRAQYTAIARERNDMYKINEYINM